ncbi:MAG: hypothetical protein M4579_006835 [Chaenotheca gracillima]|nr:MAG: hypothetical protein M4579_006835 [Chaenotheca gracillima]
MLPPFRIRQVRASHHPFGPDVSDELDFAPVVDEACAIVEIDEFQYEDIVAERPDAVLTYMDDDDGEVITVGSSLELAQRLQEPTSSSNTLPALPGVTTSDSAYHIFDVNRSLEVLDIWKKLEVGYQPPDKGKGRANSPSTDDAPVSSSTRRVNDWLSESESSELNSDLDHARRLGTSTVPGSFVSPLPSVVESLPKPHVSSPLCEEIRVSEPVADEGQDSKEKVRSSLPEAQKPLLESFSEELAQMIDATLGNERSVQESQPDSQDRKEAAAQDPPMEDPPAPSRPASNQPPSPIDLLNQAMPLLLGGLNLLTAELQNHVPKAREHLKVAQRQVNQSIEKMFQDLRNGLQPSMASLSQSLQHASTATISDLGTHVQTVAASLQEIHEGARRAAGSAREHDYEVVRHVLEQWLELAVNQAKMGAQFFAPVPQPASASGSQPQPPSAAQDEQVGASSAEDHNDADRRDETAPAPEAEVVKDVKLGTETEQPTLAPTDAASPNKAADVDTQASSTDAGVGQVLSDHAKKVTEMPPSSASRSAQSGAGGRARPLGPFEVAQRAWSAKVPQSAEHRKNMRTLDDHLIQSLPIAPHPQPPPQVTHGGPDQLLGSDFISDPQFFGPAYPGWRRRSPLRRRSSPNSLSRSQTVSHPNPHIRYSPYFAGRSGSFGIQNPPTAPWMSKPQTTQHEGTSSQVQGYSPSTQFSSIDDEEYSRLVAAGAYAEANALAKSVVDKLPHKATPVQNSEVLPHDSQSRPKQESTSRPSGPPIDLLSTEADEAMSRFPSLSQFEGAPRVVGENGHKDGARGKNGEVRSSNPLVDLPMSHSPAPYPGTYDGAMSHTAFLQNQGERSPPRAAGVGPSQNQPRQVPSSFLPTSYSPPHPHPHPNPIQQFPFRRPNPTAANRDGTPSWAVRSSNTAEDNWVAMWLDSHPSAHIPEQQDLQWITAQTGLSAGEVFAQINHRRLRWLETARTPGFGGPKVPAHRLASKTVHQTLPSLPNGRAPLARPANLSQPEPGARLAGPFDPMAESVTLHRRRLIDGLRRTATVGSPRHMRDPRAYFGPGRDHAHRTSPSSGEDSKRPIENLGRAATMAQRESRPQNTGGPLGNGNERFEQFHMPGQFPTEEHTNTARPSNHRASLPNSSALNPFEIGNPDPKVLQCVEDLQMMGFGFEREGGVERLFVYAQAGEGDIEKTLEILEEDQKAERERNAK